jgi:hypothetical protein
MTHKLATARVFQIWEYRVSHGSLLIRSPKGSDGSSNIDIVCVGVEYIASPTLLRGVEILKPSTDEMDALEKTLGTSLAAASVHVIASSGQRYLIVAAGVRVEHHERDIFESPFE